MLGRKLCSFILGLRFYKSHRHEETICSFRFVQLLSHVQLFATSWTMARQTSLSFTHCLPESAQTHVHWVGDTIQPSHTLLPLSPSAFNLPQHQGLFHWVSSYQVTKVLELQLQHQLHANKKVFKPGNLCIKSIWKQHKGLKGNKGSQWQRSQGRGCCS